MTKSTNSDFQSSDTTKFEVGFAMLTQRLHREFVDKLDLARLGDLEGDAVRREVWQMAERVCDTRSKKEKILLNSCERERLIEALLDQAFGLGPLEWLLKDPTNRIILIKDPREVYVERGGQLCKTNVVFCDDAHLRQIIDRIASKDGCQVREPLGPLGSEGGCIVIRHSESDSSMLEVFFSSWSPPPPTAGGEKACC